MYHHPEMSPSPDLATSPLTKPESLALLRPAGQTETCRRRAKHACSDRLAARQTSVPIPIQEPPSDTANSACTVYIHPRCHSPTSFLFPSIEAMPATQIRHLPRSWTSRCSLRDCHPDTLRAPTRTSTNDHLSRPNEMHHSPLCQNEPPRLVWIGAAWGDCLGTAADDICKNLNTCLVQGLATIPDRCSLQHPEAAVVNKSSWRLKTDPSLRLALPLDGGKVEEALQLPSPPSFDTAARRPT